MSAKKAASKKDDSKAVTPSPRKPYIPRQGTLPARIFSWLVQRPMPFAELSDRGRRETNLSGEELGSQLSAALYDLCKRGAVVRIDPSTRSIIPSKGARGAFYGLSPEAKKHYKSATSGSNGAASHSEPRQIDLSAFSPQAAVLMSKPDRMPSEVYSVLSQKRSEAEKQIAAIDAIMSIWS